MCVWRPWICPSCSQLYVAQLPFAVKLIVRRYLQGICHLADEVNCCVDARMVDPGFARQANQGSS